MIYDEKKEKSVSVSISMEPTVCEKKLVDIKSLLKKTLKSRLTGCQFILLTLNIIALITIIVLAIVLRKQFHPDNDMSPKSKLIRRFFSLKISLLNLIGVFFIKEGIWQGTMDGGNPFNDAISKSLTLNDRITCIYAVWSSETLALLQFTYSNNATTQHGSWDNTQQTDHTGTFCLQNGESFKGVTFYRGLRKINNPFSPNGTAILVGVQFSTNLNRQSELFGSSSSADSMTETNPDYDLAYARGRSYGFVDALQFVWIKRKTSDPSMLLSNI